MGEGAAPELSVGEKQRLFAGLIGKLLVHIYEQGDAATIDWGYRPPEVAAYYKGIGVGIRSSLHTLKLAQDLNLFKKDAQGKWQWCRSSEEHRPYGEFWEGLHPLCRWGGRFGDGNHYSVTHDGVK